MNEALEDSTRQKYDSQWKQFEAYCEGLKFKTDEPIAIVSFVEYLTTHHYAFGTIKGFVSAVFDKFRHLESNPALSSYVSMAKKSASKKAPAVKRRDPLTREHLLSLSAKVNRSKFIEVRDFFMILLAYRGFLRGDEVVNLLSDEVWIDTFDSSDTPTELIPASFSREILWITITSSKTNSQKQKLAYDERSVENVIVGPDISPEIDPITWFRLYQSLRDKTADWFFHRVDSGDRDTSLAKGSFNHIVKNRCKETGINDLNIGGHSCRAGGATDAARKRVETRLIARHGRWKSDAVFIYMHDDQSGELQLNAALGGFSQHPLHSSSSSSSTAASSANTASSASSASVLTHSK
jgi:integrase